MTKLKVLTVVGTRPEIIRLSEIIKKLDKFTNNILVNTGQNFHFNLSKVFFKDLDLRKPDYEIKIKAKIYISKLVILLKMLEILYLKKSPMLLLF